MYNKQGIYLREKFHRPGISCLVGTYSALGAKLAERTGFDGIWSSGARDINLTCVAGRKHLVYQQKLKVRGR
jgi:2-methylisocitrate lyase-like PEP mutase family enzyme